MKNFKSFINEAGPNAKPKAKGEADFVDAHKVEISDPEEQGTDGSAKVTTKEGSGKRKADRLDNKQAMGEEVEEFDEELTADQIKKHKELAAKHRELAKSSGGEKRVAHQRAANLHVGATKNTWYKKGSTDAHKASKKLGVSEEVEELDELSKSTLASYAKKATHDSRIKHGIGKDFERIKNSSRKPEYKQGAKEWEDKYKSDARRREAGANKAIDRLAKEEVEKLDELKKSTLASYVKKRVKQLPKIEVGYQMAPSDRDARMVKKYQSKVNKGIVRAVDRLAKEEVELDEEQLIEMDKSGAPFTPNKPKKNPPAKAGKYGQGPSTAKHLAQMALKKQLEKMKEEVEEVEEAAYTNPGLEALAKKKKSLRQMKQGMKEADFSKQQTKMAHTIGKEFEKKGVGDQYKGGPYAVASAMVRDKPESAKKAYKTIQSKMKEEADTELLFKLYNDLNEENQEFFMHQLEEDAESLLDFAKMLEE